MEQVCRSINRTVKIYLKDGSKCYRFTNKYIIERLDITPKEQEKLKTIISTEEKYKRNNKRRSEAIRNKDGLTNKQRQMNKLKEQAVELKSRGLSYRSIAKELNKSVGSIQNLLKD